MTWKDIPRRISRLMPFSWEESKKRAIKHIIQQQKYIALAGENKDFKMAHQKEVSDAVQKNFVELTKRVTLDLTSKQLSALKRRDKLVGKK